MATSRDLPTGAALDAILSGYSARAGLAAYRQSGGRVATGTWYKLTGELQAMLAAREGIYDEPINRRPVASEIQRWDTAKAKGYIQQVEVLVRDRSTGEIMSIPFSVTGRTLVARSTALAKALEVYGGENLKKYPQQLLGAVYTGTYQAVPVGV
jgi:hypothetical protein